MAPVYWNLVAAAIAPQLATRIRKACIPVQIERGERSSGASYTDEWRLPARGLGGAILSPLGA